MNADADYPSEQYVHMMGDYGGITGGELRELCCLALRPPANKMKWRPIETAPRDGSEVLTLFRGSCRNGTFVYMGGNPISGKKWPIFNSPEGLLFAPSHWMPISHPSEDEK